MFSSKPLPIDEQIEEYALWKSARHPFIAGAESALLKRLARSFKIQSVTDITPDVALYFAGEELSQFYTGRALVAIRGFLRYCRWAGYPCIKPNDLDMQGIPGRPKKTTYDSEIRRLKERGMNPFEIHKKLVERHPNEKIHRTSVYRWYSRVAGQ